MLQRAHAFGPICHLTRRSLDRLTSGLFRVFLLGAAALFVGLSLAAMPAAAQTSDVRSFALNQQMIKDLSATGTNAACDYESVLEDLFKQIGPDVNVYPTENYFYFKFIREGKSFSGSLRLAAGQRDKGILQFACYETYTSWIDQDSVELIWHDLSSAHGVDVVKLARLKYAVAFKGRTVRFQLNDLDQSPPETVQQHETFVGRIFDESGLVFQLHYHAKKKFFFFVLDQQQAVAERFVKTDGDLLVGKRTGFVFYRDQAERHILIAVHANEVYTNSWNDGPFDQLPENFYEQLGFWETVFDFNPSLRGKVSKTGVMLDDPETIFAIWAYREYKTQDDLGFVTDCKTQHNEPVALLSCLTDQLAE